jgi:hypothetical protein
MNVPSPPRTTIELENLIPKIRAGHTNFVRLNERVAWLQKNLVYFVLTMPWRRAERCNIFAPNALKTLIFSALNGVARMPPRKLLDLLGNRNGQLLFGSNTSVARAKMMWTSSRWAVAVALPALFLSAESATPAFCGDQKIAQLSRVTASGTHTCGAGKDHRCVVSGGFSDCNDATITLKTRDCCITTPKGGTSSGFVLNYCIPERPL